MKIIGLTGSVGSGKSTVGTWISENYFAKMVMTDKLGHKAMEPGQTSYEKIVETFGKDIVLEDGSIDRKKLGNIVFADSAKLEMLDNIIHPWVKQYLREDIKKEQENGTYDFYIMESAILFQTNLDESCDEIWFVDVSDEVRRKRLKESRGYTDEKIDDILKKQSENVAYKQKCNLVLLNDKDKDYVLEQFKAYLYSA